MRRGVFSFSVAVFGTLGTWGTREESTRERLALLALAAAAVDEDEAAEAEAGVKMEDEAAFIVVTGLGGRACRIGAAVLLEEEDVELELEEATEAASLFCRREWIESVREGFDSAPPAVECDDGEVARGDCGSGAIGR